jgi:hypothetical protein
MVIILVWAKFRRRRKGKMMQIGNFIMDQIGRRQGSDRPPVTLIYLKISPKKAFKTEKMSFFVG